MIFGSIIQSKDLGAHEGFDLAIFMVNNPGYVTHSKKTQVVSVTMVAMRDGVTLGGFDVPYVVHHLTKPNKHAFNQLNIKLMREAAIEDARESLHRLAT